MIEYFSSIAKQMFVGISSIFYGYVSIALFGYYLNSDNINEFTASVVFLTISFILQHYFEEV